MNKTITAIIGIMLLCTISSYAQTAMTATTEDYDKLDFTKMRLNYTWSDVQYNPDTMTIYADVTYFSAKPFMVNDDKNFYITRKTTRYSYDGTDFWDCTLTIADTLCFQQHIYPAWQRRFIILDKVQRSYLRSMQNGGVHIFSDELRDFMSRLNT